MKNKYIFTAVMLCAIMFAGTLLTGLYVRHEQRSTKHMHSSGARQFRVVTSFYPMYIAAKNIIGDCDGVTLENLSEPQTGCLHDYQLTTQDMVKLSSADVFIVNGGGIESFLADVAAQYPALTIIEASADVQLIEDNAHAWMSIPDYMTQVSTIAQGLSGQNAVHEEYYEKNCQEYLSRLDTLRQRQQELAAAHRGRSIVIFHEAFDYIARDCGFRVSAVLDLDEERQVSAGEAADLLRHIREDHADLILAEERYGKRMCESIQKEETVKAVYLDTCVRGDYTADSYINAMEENLEKLEEALESV